MSYIIEELQQLVNSQEAMINTLKEENERLTRQLNDIRRAAKEVHNSVIELDSLICL